MTLQCGHGSLLVHGHIVPQIVRLQKSRGPFRRRTSLYSVHHKIWPIGDFVGNLRRHTASRRPQHTRSQKLLQPLQSRSPCRALLPRLDDKLVVRRVGRRRFFLRSHPLQMLEVDLLSAEDAPDLRHKPRQLARKLGPPNRRFRLGHQLLADEVFQSRNDAMMLSDPSCRFILVLPDVLKPASGHRPTSHALGQKLVL
jgi:hypothetical protein